MPSKKHQSAIERTQAFMVKIEDLVREIVIQNSIPYYRIESCMEHNALTDAENGYVPVIRIVTYFEDTVSQIADILCTEFDIDTETPTEHKKTGAEAFSYKHVQYIASLKQNRKELTEYARSGNNQFEVQVCSMLQDAWAGIERELGYDEAVSSDEAKRDLYRVGALLEMADIEFLKIRSRLKKEAEPAAAPENTFAGYLQAVAKETPAPTYNGQWPGTTLGIPEQFQPNHYQAVQLSAPEAFMPSMSQPPAYTPPAAIYTPPPVAPPQPAFVPPVAPVAKMPEPFMPPQAIVTPVQPAVPEAVAAPKAAPIEATPAPQAAPAPSFGLAPQRTKTPSAYGLAPAQVKAPKVSFAHEEKHEKVNIAPEATSIAAPPVAAESPLNMESMDMNVDSFKSLAMNINHVDNKNGITDDQLADLTHQGVLPETPEAIIPEPIAETPAEKVALNIDNVHNFNMNVNGMIERTTEIIREEKKPEEKVIAFEEAPKAKTPALDENAPMTDASLREYVLNSKLLKEVDQKIAERAGAKINPEVDIEGDVERLRFLKVFTLKQLHDRITDNKNDIVSFAEKWIGKDNGGSFDSGICLFYLEYLLVGKKNDPAFAIEYVVKFISDNDYSARYIIPTYNSIRNVEAPNFSHLTLKA